MPVSGSISTHLKVRHDASPVRFAQEFYLLDACGETCVQLVDGLSVGMDTLYNLAVNPLDEADRMLQFSVLDGVMRMRARHPYVLSKDWVQVGSVRVSAGQKVTLPIGEISFSPSFAPCAVTEEYMIEMRQLAKPQSQTGLQDKVATSAKTEVSTAVKKTAIASENQAVPKAEPQLLQELKSKPTTKKATTKRATTKTAKTKTAKTKTAVTQKTKNKRTSTVVSIPLPPQPTSKQLSNLQRERVHARTGSLPPKFNAAKQVAKISYGERLRFFYWRLNRDAAVLKTLVGLFGLGLGVAFVVAVTQMEPQSIKLTEPVREESSLPVADTVAVTVPIVEAQSKVEAPVSEIQPEAIATNAVQMPELILQLVPPTLPRYVDRTLDEAQRLLSEGKVVWPQRHNAVELTLSALATEPDNPRAIQLLKNARYILLTVAQDSYEEGYRHDAYDLVERILAFDPGEQDVAALRERWITDRPVELRYLTRHRN